MKISDETQRDTKERDHMGAGKHERLFFSMSPTGPRTSESIPLTVRDLVDRLMARGKGSYISSVLRDCTVRVEVLNMDRLWKWEVRKAMEVVDYGIAIMTPEHKVELRQGPQHTACPNCRGSGIYDDQTCTFCDGECQVDTKEAS